ncbi:hypothetical protein apy_12510 [Aeropyrum pernix]|uniref:Glycosyl transferase family 1 domain-containing protein n=2 Tax=Aeropyrum pernix TaxID=56636 RepID=A0A401HAN8_AERPX|nr:hypothetical protein apy_12510 [Aeropyrum pernix]
MTIVTTKIPHVKCIIAGKGDRKVYKELSDLTKRLGIKENIILEENLTEEEKLDILRKAWICIIPSMKEGFSISALEAQSCGTPIVAYKVPGLDNSVRDNLTGLLVPEGDYRALAKAIIDLLLNEELRLKMSQAARQHALSFSWENSARRFLILIAEVARHEC